MAQLISVRLNRPDGCPLGFRLQGGKDFGTPLVIQKVNGGSPAEKAGLLAGDSVIKVNTTDVFNLRHKEAQDVIVQAGQNFDVTIQRGGSTWKPSVSAVGSLPSPVRSMNSMSPVTQTSLKHNQQQSHNIGSGHNTAAKPFNYMNGNGDSTVKSIVNKQYNTPVGIYSEETIAETLSAQAEVLAGGVLGVNFKKNEKTYDSEKSEVFKMLQEADNDPEPEVSIQSPAASGTSGLRHVTAPISRPDQPANNTGGLPPGQNICEECERLIIGVFVRIKDKNLHVECFKCATCGSSLKNQGYYNLNGKLYCDIHAKMVARQNPPAPNLEPVTFPQLKPASTISSVLSSHSVPLPPLANPIMPLVGNGLSTLLNKNDLNGNLTEISLKLNQDNVDAFANILSNNDEEKETLQSSFNTLTHGSVTSGISNNTETAPSDKSTPMNGITNNLLSVYPISVQAQSPSSPFSNASSGVFKKVIPPHMGGNYKPSSNISGPKPFGAPMSPAMHSPVSSLSPRSAVTAPLSPASPASTLSRPSQHPAPPPQPITDESTNNIQEQLVKKRLEYPVNGMTNNSIMKQLSKTAFNGTYEIGIQRKIKPGDHIASMANKIKDTVVLKHPLNSNDFTNSVNENSKFSKFGNGTFPNQSLNMKNVCINQNLSMVPQPIINNFPGNIPPPPPPPKFKVGSLSPVHNSNINPSPSISQSSSPMTSLSGSGSLSPVYERQYQSSDVSDTPLKQLTSALFNKIIKKDSLDHGKPEVDKKCISLQKDQTNENHINVQMRKPSVEPSIVLQNNSETNNMTKNYKNLDNDLPKSMLFSATEKLHDNEKTNISNEHPVKLRDKKKNTLNEKSSGKRDSHVTSRPLSTIASVDLVDGVYPICNQCNKQITRGPFITALGRIWCPEHFVCVNNTCRRHLQDIGFVEENGQLYCEYCFEQFIAPACDKCHGKIKGDCLNAIGKHFHPECFNCAYCGKLFGNNPFFLEEGLPYCEADWNELFTTKCIACGFPVEAGDRWVEALNNNYHSQCFNCTMCKKNLEGQSFYAKGGRPFCKSHAR